MSGQVLTTLVNLHPYAFNQESIPKSSYFGIVDTAGFAKDDYYLYQSQWLDAETDPMVHIFPHWNWENESLKNKVLIDGKIPVRVYSNAASVELFLNDESLGEKSFAQKTTEDGRTYQQQSDESDRLYLEWLLEYEYIRDQDHRKGKRQGRKLDRHRFDHNRRGSS